MLEEAISNWYIKRVRIEIVVFTIIILQFISMWEGIERKSTTETRTVIMHEESQTVKVQKMNSQPQVLEIRELIQDEATYYREMISHLSEQELLASLMYHEEGVLLSKIDYQDAKRAHLLAGSVVLHRTNMNFMGAKTIEDTIFAKGQYTHTLPKLANPVPEEVLEWAGELLENGPIGPKDLIYQAQFIQGDGIYEKIDNQYFCTDGEYDN